MSVVRMIGAAAASSSSPHHESMYGTVRASFWPCLKSGVDVGKLFLRSQKQVISSRVMKFKSPVLPILFSIMSAFAFADDGFKPLFNLKNFEGWKQHSGTA